MGQNCLFNVLVHTKKGVGYKLSREYNTTVMCSRLTHSHSHTRIIAGLYVFLAAFLLGFFAVQTVVWLDASVLSPSEYADLESTIDAPQATTCSDNKDGVSLFRWSGGPGKEHEREMSVINRGSETIYYYPDSLAVDSFRDGVKSPAYSYYPEAERSQNFDGRVGKIESGDSEGFWLIPDEDNALNATFEYYVGDARSWRRIDLHFGDQAQLGDGCNFPF